MKYTIDGGLGPMISSSGWLYLGENSVWASEYRLTIPTCVFDEYELLSRDQLGWWIYDDNAEALQIANKLIDDDPEIATYAKISNPGDGSSTCFFTIPEAFRKESESDNKPHEKNVPNDLLLTHETPLHFVSTTDLVAGNTRSFYVFTIEELESRVEDPRQWEADPKSIARLLDSSASHLFNDEEITGDLTISREKNSEVPDDSLADRLHIQRNDVPEKFSIKYSDIIFNEIPRDIYEYIDMSYLLVRYGTINRTKQNMAEDPELLMNLNKEVGVETTHIEGDEKIRAKVPFCIHDRHALEFKFFVDVCDDQLLEKVKGIFAQSDSCMSSSISDSLEDRVYILHKDFRTKETDSGFVNNVLYPK